MKVLVTGATGFVGLHVVQTLLSAGHEVHALVRKASAHQGLLRMGVQLVYGDLAGDLSPLPAVEAVIHLAGLIKARRSQEFFEVNEQGTRRLVEALSGNPPGRFIYVSSIAARGPNVDGTSLAAKGPVSDYGMSKRAGERVALEGLKSASVVIVRPPIVYGPGDKETLTIFRLLKRGFFPVIGQGQMRTSFIHVHDLANSLMAAATGTESIVEPLYPDDGAAGHAVQNLIDCGAAIFSRRVRELRVPLVALKLLCGCSEYFAKILKRAPMLSRGKFLEMREPHWFCENTDLLTFYKNLPPSIALQDGFASTAKWYAEQGWL